MEQQLFMFREEILPSTLTKGFVKMSDKLLVTSNFDENFNENITDIYDGSQWKGIDPLSYRQIVSSSPPAFEYAMFPWLPIQGIAFIFAATGVGKTLFAMNAGYAMASGGNFLRYKCPKPRRVLYVDGEMAFNQVYSRFMSIVKQQGKLLFEDNFMLYTPDKANIRPFKICQPEGQAFYTSKVEENGIDVLILDNLSVLSAFDENSSSEWKAIQDWLLSLREKGITIMVVHHSGKDKSGYRGTSRMLDCADSAICLQNMCGDDLESEKIMARKFKISYPKNRHFGGIHAIPFEVSLSEDGWSFDSSDKNNTQRIMEMLDMGMKAPQIAKSMSVTDTYVYKIIREQRKKGVIIK